MNAPARPEFFANVALSVSEYVSSYVTTVLRETSYRYYTGRWVSLSSTQVGKREAYWSITTVIPS